MEFSFTIDGKAPGSEPGIPHLGIMEGYIQEGINQVTLIELDIVTTTLLEEADCEGLIGKNVTLALGDVIGADLIWSRWDGMIFEIQISDAAQVEEGQYLYKLIIRPPLWMLNFTCLSGSFPETTRIQVIDEILESNGLRKGVLYETRYEDEKAYRKMHQILQTEISDLAFLQQLMQEAGINYYFQADRSGETSEILTIVDSSGKFGQRWETPVSWMPATGQAEVSRCVRSFQTNIHTTPSKVSATLSLGDGLAKSFSTNPPVNVPGGAGQVVYIKGREGAATDDATRVAKQMSQALAANRVIYEGRSNDFLIRAGERVPVQRFRVEGGIKKKEGQAKNTLVTSVRHTIRQSATVALGGAWDPEYRNSFSAVRDDVDLRPMQFGTQQVSELISSRRDRCSSVVTDSIDSLSCEATQGEAAQPFMEGAQGDRSQTGAGKAERNLGDYRRFGLMMGIVIEDATVNNNNELTCKIKSDHYPAEFTAKVALNWLTNKGGLSLFPRKDMQVYFQLIQGEGGQHEAVILGYRPTNLVKTLDPSKTTETKKLAGGKLKDDGTGAVGKDTYAPPNRQRNTLIGEAGVAEVAVIDGGEDSVAIHANKGVHIVGDKEVHLDGATQLHKAGSLSQQFGTVSRGVSGDQKEAIGGNHEMTVIGSQSITLDTSFEQKVKGGIEISSKEGDVAVKSSDGNKVSLKSGPDTKMVLESNSRAYLDSGNNTLLIEKDANKVSMRAEEHAVVWANKLAELNAGGDVGVTADNDGGKLEIVAGSTTITIDKNSGNIKIAGQSIDLNC